MCLEYQQTQPQEKAIPMKVPCKPWKVIGADVFLIKNKTPLCTVHYYRNFPIFKRDDSVTADGLVIAAKIVFAEFGLSKKIISDAGMNFTSEIFRQFTGR